MKKYPEYENKAFTAPSGINFEPVKREWNLKDKIKVLACGQFIKRKNIDKVIEACERFENIELTVIGSGKEEKYYSKISKEGMDFMTKTSMIASDLFNMVKMIHLKLK